MFSNIYVIKCQLRMVQEKHSMTTSNFILIMSDKNQEIADNNAFYELPATAHSLKPH